MIQEVREVRNSTPWTAEMWKSQGLCNAVTIGSFTSARRAGSGRTGSEAAGTCRRSEGRTL